jgi:hypothetical protein
MKFKPGDKIVVIDPYESSIQRTPKFDFYDKVFKVHSVSNSLITVKCNDLWVGLFEIEVEYEKIYNSPLYKALQEKE